MNLPLVLVIFGVLLVVYILFGSLIPFGALASLPYYFVVTVLYLYSTYMLHVLLLLYFGVIFYFAYQKAWLVAALLLLGLIIVATVYMYLLYSLSSLQ